MDNSKLIQQFYQAGIIKFGSFTLKDGSTSPYYIDLRLLVSFPTLLTDVCTRLCELIREKGLEYDNVAGVPLAGIPLGTLVGVYEGKPGLLLRKEAKGYGCKKAIEGFYKPSNRVLLIDDVVTSTSSKREAIELLESHDLRCNDIVVVIDRRVSVSDDLNIHALMTMSEIITTLLNYPDLRSDDRKCLEKLQ